jgi:hypothetical protein
MVLFCILGLWSCAGMYHETKVAAYNYTIKHQNLNDSIDYYYINDIMQKHKFRKYKNKEKRKGVAMVAVKLVNNSTDTIAVSYEKLNVYINQKKATLLSPLEYYTKVKQISWLYLCWCPISYISTKTEFRTSPPYGLYTTRKVYPVGLPIGLYNFFIARAANKNLKKDVINNDLMGRKIYPGGVATGYIYIQNPEGKELVINLDH